VDLRDPLKLAMNEESMSMGVNTRRELQNSWEEIVPVQ
jgi:hypothetical protein